jgi:antirestriction protein
MEFRIYLASLSDYNNAILHGVWFDIDSTTTKEDIYDAINKMLAESPATKKYGELAEEYAIHDYEGFRSISEWEDFDTLLTYVERYEKYGEAWVAYEEYYGSQWATEDDFENRYIGEYESEEEFGEQYLDDTCMLSEVPESVRYYFDTERFTRDLFTNDVTGVEENDSVYVFYN